jgi:hypothetical protein
MSDDLPAWEPCQDCETVEWETDPYLPGSKKINEKNVDQINLVGYSFSRQRETNPAPTENIMTALATRFTAKINSATLADAKEWNETSEKTVFCIDFLDAFSVTQIDTFWQDALEDRFEALLAN